MEAKRSGPGGVLSVRDPLHPFERPIRSIMVSSIVSTSIDFPALLLHTYTCVPVNPTTTIGGKADEEER